MSKFFVLFLITGVTPTAVIIGKGNFEYKLAELKKSSENPNKKDLKFVEFRDLSKNDEIIKVSINELLYGALAAEMPLRFEVEALKAQAVAVYSYFVDKTDNLKNIISLNSKSGNNGILHFCYKDEQSRRKLWGKKFDEYEKKLKLAVDSIYNDGSYEVLKYNGKIAKTFFFSSCYKETNSCESVFGGKYPYLISVSSNECSEQYIKKFSQDMEKFNFCKKIKSKEVKERLCSLFKGNESVCEKIKKASCESLFSKMEKSNSGIVDKLEIFGNKIKGTKIRFALGLRSTNFTIKYIKKSDEFEFDVKGFGHGVGMSQCGANELATQGKKYNEILEHYYPGTNLCRLKFEK